MTNMFRAIALASVLAFAGTTMVTPMVSTISAEAQVKPAPKKLKKITKGKKAKKAVKVKKASKAKKATKAQKAAAAQKRCGPNMYRKGGKCVAARSVK